MSSSIGRFIRRRDLLKLLGVAPLAMPAAAAVKSEARWSAWLPGELMTRGEALTTLSIDPSDRLLELAEEWQKNPRHLMPGEQFAYAIPVDNGFCYAVMVGCPAPNRLAGARINADGDAV